MSTAPIVERSEDRLQLEFPENALAQALYGSHNLHLSIIEQALDVRMNTRGNRVILSGDPDQVETAAAVLESLYDRLLKNLDVDRHEVEAAVRIAGHGGSGEVDSRKVLAGDFGMLIRTKRRHISPRTSNQAEYLRLIDKHDLVFATGPAGTGKTYLAVAKAVERLIDGRVDRIILSRPAVEAGEQLGFLPGDLREKVDPYLRPLYDALHDMLPADKVREGLESGRIEAAPLAFMRGRTLADAFVILDEAQNTTEVQMKMLLTRLGENASMVITGDLSQVDLPRGTRSGMRDAMDVLKGVKGVARIDFSSADVVRHPLVEKIVRAYEKAEAKTHAADRYEKKRQGDHGS